MVRESTSPGPHSSVGPSQGRRSSVQPQAARPFRGRGNVHVGRRTGVALPETERLSNGFEDFNNVLNAAEKGHGALKRKRRLMIEETDEILNEYLSEHAEDSMDHETPAKPHRSSLSSRTSRARPSGAATEDIPSSSPTRRKSYASGLGVEEDDDDENEPFNYSMGANSFDDESPQPSFSQINADDDEDDDPVQDEAVIESPIKPLSTHGDDRYARALSVVPEEEEEDERDVSGMIGFDSPDEPQEQEEIEEMEEEPPKKKAKTTKKGKGRVAVESASKSTKSTIGASRKKKENRSSAVPEGAIHVKIPKKPAVSQQQGLRRSKRYHMKPLDWWRNEKVVYGRPSPPPTPENSDDEGEITYRPKLALPHIKEIIRIPRQDAIPLGKAGQKRRARARSRSQSRAPTQQVKIVHEYVNKPSERTSAPEIQEEGWDDDTERYCTVLSWPVSDEEQPKEVYRKIAFPAGDYTPKQASNRSWLYQKTFGDADFVASGFLVIPPGERKPSKGSKDNTYMFYLAEGAVNLAIHQSNRIIAQGGMFMVPRGNTYYIENISNRNAKLVFTQARKMKEGEEDRPPENEEEGDEERTTVDREDHTS